MIWKVLGAENGKILLISADNIDANEDEYFYMFVEKFYINGIKELNNICNIYGYGIEAQSTRSVTVEDVNKITGYDPKINGSAYDGLNEYGNIVTYEIVEGEFTYTTTNGLSEKVKNNNIIVNGMFWYIKDEEWKEVLNPGERRIFDINVYKYSASQDSSYAEKRKINMNMSSNSKEYKMLFKNSKDSNEARYYLASRVIKMRDDYNYAINYGLRTVSYGGVGNSTGVLENELSNNTYGVRAVVTLKSDVKLNSTKTENGITTWDIVK